MALAVRLGFRFGIFSSELHRRCGTYSNLFVFDASNSMNAMWGKHRKIRNGHRPLAKPFEELNQNDKLELGVHVYGHGTKHVIGQQNCEDTELIVPLGTDNKLLIKQSLNRLQAQGTTPIARSEQAAYDFQNRQVEMSSC